MRIKFFILFLCMIFLIENISGLGITPARTTINFEPNMELTKEFTIINSENKDINLVVAVQGTLKDYISISQTSFSMSSNEKSKQIGYIVNLPDKLEPGLKSAEIVILQLPQESGVSEAFVGAALAIIHQIHVYVPYPGKYAEVDLNIIDANQNEDVIFIIPVVSRGEHDLVSVKANIDVFNQLGEKITSFNTVEISVNSGQRKDLVHRWKAEVPVGRYLAKVALIYDGETKNLERQFKVGKPDLELQNIEVRDFRLGEIAKFEMLIENKWSEPIKNAYTEMQIFDRGNQLISNVKSASYDFDALSKKVLVSFWDTAGVREGDYEAKLFLRYGEQSTQKNLELKVSNDNIRIVGVGYVISSAEPTRGDNLVFVLIVGIVLLILINLLWFLVIRNKLKK